MMPSNVALNDPPARLSTHDRSHAECEFLHLLRILGTMPVFAYVANKITGSMQSIPFTRQTPRMYRHSRRECSWHQLADPCKARTRTTSPYRNNCNMCCQNVSHSFYTKHLLTRTCLRRKCPGSRSARCKSSPQVRRPRLAVFQGIG